MKFNLVVLSSSDESFLKGGNVLWYFFIFLDLVLFSSPNGVERTRLRRDFGKKPLELNLITLFLFGEHILYMSSVL